VSVDYDETVPGFKQARISGGRVIINDDQPGGVMAALSCERRALRCGCSILTSQKVVKKTRARLGE
jgi:hypothetical protein